MKRLATLFALLLLLIPASADAHKREWSKRLAPGESYGLVKLGCLRKVEVFTGSRQRPQRIFRFQVSPGTRSSTDQPGYVLLGPWVIDLRVTNSDSAEVGNATRRKVIRVTYTTNCS